MGEAHKETLRVDFDSRIKLEFYGAAVITDTGSVASRELSVSETCGERFADERREASGSIPWLGRRRRFAQAVKHTITCAVYLSVSNIFQNIV